ncbi:trypsin-like isoform X1 [Paramisgurnus dabryanus]|uniref:trypsin-like isoform X1 n=1 Tax=Paramisgurnus dabryanus TaxID=90735 RepID=UPI003CCF7424
MNLMASSHNRIAKTTNYARFLLICRCLVLLVIAACIHNANETLDGGGYYTHQKMKFNALCVCIAGVILLNISGSFCQAFECGQAPLNTKIVGGEDASAGSWPWQVSLQSSTYGGHFCGGSLISHSWILSAAHCFTSVSTNTIVVYIGRQSQTDSNPNEMSSTVSQVFTHPSYSNLTENNDLALLRLSSPVVYSNYIQPVCLAGTGSTVGAGTLSWITGWGKVDPNSNQLPTILQEVDIPIVSESSCQNAYGPDITDNMICAGLSQGGKDSCQGDSGGPLVVRKGTQWIQCGIVSFGQGCAEPGFPGVYTKVSSYENWIVSHISSDQPGFVRFSSVDTTDTSFSNDSSNYFVVSLFHIFTIITLLFLY